MTFLGGRLYRNGPNSTSDQLYNVGTTFYVLPAPEGYFLGGVFECRTLECNEDNGRVGTCSEQLQQCDAGLYKGRYMAKLPPGKYTKQLPVLQPSQASLAEPRIQTKWWSTLPGQSQAAWNQFVAGRRE